MKKIILCVSALILTSTVILTSCGNKNGNSDESQSETTTEKVEDTLSNTNDSSENESSEETSAVNDDSAQDEEKTKSSKSEIAELLKSYKKYVDDYVSIMKKASRGDMTAIAKYPELLSDAEDLQNKLENYSSEMTVDQLNEFNKITQKMAQAAASMKP